MSQEAKNMGTSIMPNEPIKDCKAPMEELGTTFAIDPVKEKKMMRKFDVSETSCVPCCDGSDLNVALCTPFNWDHVYVL